MAQNENNRDEASKAKETDDVTDLKRADVAPSLPDAKVNEVSAEVEIAKYRAEQEKEGKKERKEDKKEEK